MRPTSLAARWIVASTAPLLVVVIVAAAIDVSSGGSAVALFGHIALVASAGLLQALVLRPYGMAPWRWIGATVLGFAAGMACGIGSLATLDGLGHELLGMVLGTALFGLALGSAQGLAMRRERGWPVVWVGASMIAWMIVGLLWLGGWHMARGTVRGDGILSPLAKLYESGNAELLLLSVGLAGSALLTAPLLARILSAPRPRASASVASDARS